MFKGLREGSVRATVRKGDQSSRGKEIKKVRMKKGVCAGRTKGKRAQLTEGNLRRALRKGWSESSYQKRCSICARPLSSEKWGRRIGMGAVAETS